MRHKISTCRTIFCKNYGVELKNPTNSKCYSCSQPLILLREEIASEGETIATGAIIGAIIGAVVGGPVGSVFGGLLGSAIGKANAEQEKKKRFFGGSP